MDKELEYEGVVLEDGHLSLPEFVKEKLRLRPLTAVAIRISRRHHSELEGAWHVLASMGDTAGEGKLDEASERHDDYLYPHDGGRGQ